MLNLTIMKNMLISSFIVLFCTLLSSHADAQAIKGTYAIKNVETGKLLRPEDANKSNGTDMVLYPPTNWKCMTWDFLHESGDTYFLKNLFTEKTFQPAEKKKEPGTQLEQEPLARNDLQAWEFISEGSDHFRIRLRGTDLYLTPMDGKGNTNNPVVLEKKQEGAVQLWTIYEQHPMY
jgi:hypothetical protein